MFDPATTHHRCSEDSSAVNLTITEKTVFILDIDGTVAPVTCSPDGRKIEGNVFEAIQQFHAECPNQAIFSTARDSAQIRTCFDKDLSVFPNILSNGAELTFPNGEKYLYPFTKREENFIQYMHEKMRGFQETHPSILTEIKTAEVGIHRVFAKNAPDKENKDALRRAIVAARDLLVSLHDQGCRKGVPYAIKSYEKTSRALVHTKINKSDASRWFREYLPQLPQNEDWRHVVFCGDGLWSNDRQIAAKVRGLGGTVIMIRNGQNVPSSNDPVHPHIVLESPAHLGRFLKQSVDKFLKHNTL